MNLDDLPPPETMWAGKYVRVLKRGRWEYASRTNNINAVVILAEYEGQVILVDQPRVPPDCRCIELPAGLVGDEDPAATPETTAIKELEEETGFTAERIERLGEYYASPGMLSESFVLVRAHNVRRIGEGGGDENEDINVHLIPRADIPNFIEEKRAEGFGIDVKLLLFSDFQTPLQAGEANR
jgi:ADP-ribose pyrophosphatase